MYRGMNLKYGMLCSLMLLYLLGGAMGCSDDDSGQVDDNRPGNKEELMLRSYSGKLSGEASVYPDSVFFVKGNEPGKYQEVWKAYIGKKGSTTLATPKYYPADNSLIYLRGFAPAGRLTDRMTIIYPMDGQSDIVVTDEQHGCLTDMFWQDTKSFEFVHLLTQLRFRLRLDEKGVANGWKLRTIAIDGVKRDVILSLSDKSLLFNGDSSRITAVDRNGDMLQELDTVWTEIPETVMVQPAVPLSLTIMLQDSLENQIYYRQLPIVFNEENNRSVPGTSYLLSVTIRTDGTTALSASVVEWKKGNNGIGIID